MATSTTELMGAAAVTMTALSAVLLVVVASNVATRLRIRAALWIMAVGLVLLALPIYGQLSSVAFLRSNASTFRVVGALLLIAGLFILKPAGDDRLTGLFTDADADH